MHVGSYALRSTIWLKNIGTLKFYVNWGLEKRDSTIPSKKFNLNMYFKVFFF